MQTLFPDGLDLTNPVLHGERFALLGVNPLLLAYNTSKPLVRHDCCHSTKLQTITF